MTSTSDKSPTASNIPNGVSTSFSPPVKPRDNNVPDTPDSSLGSTESSIKEQPSLSEGLASIRPYDLTGIHLRPCARESLLFGMGSGFAIGGLRLVLGANQHKAMSWAIGAFCVMSASAHAVCQEKRKLEKAAMERAKEIMERKKKEKIEEMRQERDLRREIEDKKQPQGWATWLGFGREKR